MYSAYHLSFTSVLPRNLLEELASLILANDPTGQTGQLIQSVHDQFLDFVVPSPSLFSLLPRREVKNEVNGSSGKKNGPPKEVDGAPSYEVLNDPKATEVEIEDEVERVAKGLFSVIVTMGELRETPTACELADEQALFPLSALLAATLPRWSRASWIPSCVTIFRQHPRNEEVLALAPTACSVLCL